MGKIIAALHILSFLLIPVIYSIDIFKAIFSGMGLRLKNAHILFVSDMKEAARVTIRDAESAWKGK